MKRRNILIATLVALFSFLTVVYVSCTKPGTIVSCSGSLCMNGGYCKLDTINDKTVPVCTCPVGYEGSNCGTASVTKYLGTWNLKQKILGSDSTQYNGDSSQYSVILAKAYTPTTFFIDNFFNNTQYNNIICTLDSLNSSNFIIDTISTYHMVYNTFIIQGGSGSINGDSIKATIFIEYKNQTSNWEIDTVQFKMWH